ncbi:BON domain-containing protein [Azovibrio restrictus]|uniref:BON domain-containing protein n=1 Tax=Azovibrio restrictus TaxID=146938 RepID=UPI0026ED10B7|nr:BON domain-containing protein [Azovibrio restrictus]
MNQSHHPTRRSLLGLISLGLALPALQGCFGVAVAGATVGVLAATDRRSVGVQTDDEAIELKAVGRLSKEIRDRAHINFTSYNRRVLLTGEVPDEATKARVAEEVSRIENVQGIWNELVVAGNSTLTSRSNDTYITSKVKARFIDNNQFAANHVKVVTEAGTVFLLGIVTDREAQAAIQVARNTAGVRKVVNVMQIISDAEARRIDASLANSASSTATSSSSR